jgi:hypothetical protein
MEWMEWSGWHGEGRGGAGGLPDSTESKPIGIQYLFKVGVGRARRHKPEMESLGFFSLPGLCRLEMFLIE